jgi:hypothetical protein
VTLRGQAFAYGYNWDGEAAGESALLNSKYLAGRYGGSAATLQDLIDNINGGTQSRVIVNMSATALGGTTNFLALCLGDDEVYHFGGTTNPTLLNMICGKVHAAVTLPGNNPGGFAMAINNTTSSKYWAMLSGTNTIIIFRKDGGDNDNIVIETKYQGDANADNVYFVNAETGARDSAIMNFALGGEDWGKMVASEQKDGKYSLTLLGHDIGDGMDLFIAGGTLVADTAFAAKLTNAGIAATSHYINSLRRTAFTEVQDAADGRWDGAEIRTQEAAQKALLAINDAIEKKDVMRANIGAIQNRLEGTITNLTIQVENLQASESRISDVDVATEMTEFTKNNILAQAATSMLAQANSLGALALTLIEG